MDEMKVLKRCQNGDKEAFNELITFYYPFVSKFLFKITCNKETTEDIVQETFCTAWEKLYEIKTHPSPQNWLYKTARNKIMTTMKKKMNICETPIPECELDTYEAVAYEEQFTFDDLKNVLTSNEIKMLRQHFIEGYSIKEISIANSMKIGTGTMKFSRMYKKIKNSKC